MLVRGRLLCVLPSEGLVHKVIVVEEEDGGQKGRLVVPGLVLHVEIEHIKHTH